MNSLDKMPLGPGPCIRCARRLFGKKVEVALVVFICVSGVFCLEVAGRCIYARNRGLSFFYDSEDFFYPALANEMADYSNGSVNILLLGGSVVWMSNASLGEFAVNRSWRVYNLADYAQNSLDSYYKYKTLVDRGYRFDYVVFYESINEVRANNVPPGLFSGEYNHYGYYRIRNPVFRKEFPLGLMLKSSLFYTAYKWYVSFWFRNELVPEHTPRLEWIDFGADIKTRQVYERNVQLMADIAGKEGSTFIVPIFAYNAGVKPPEGEMGEYSLPIRVWGKPENVVKGIDAHNLALREMGGEVVLIETKDISQNPANFIDICHFSKEGKAFFAKLVGDEIQRQEDLKKARIGGNRI